MGLSLYDLTAEYRAILDELDTAEGVLEGDLEARLDAIVGAHADKVDACVAMARALEAEGDAIKAEEQRLAARRKARAAQVDRLHDYVFKSMKLTKTKKVESPRFTVSIAACPPAVNLLVREDEVPAPYRIERTVVSIDKAAIKAALAAGKSLPFAELTRGERLSIR